MAVTNAASYQDTVTDVEDTSGFAPGFMEAVLEDAVVHEWPVFEPQTLGKSVVPPKCRELV